MKKIGVWGDSITWGASDDKKGGWVSRLRDHCAKAGPEVYNLGIPGEKVIDILERFEREFNDLNPDIIILAIGINDTPHSSYKKGTPLDMFEARFNELISKMKAVAADIIILGPTNVVDNHPKKHGYTNEAIKSYASIIKKAAIKNDLPYVNLWGVVTEADLEGDGLHPEAEGHQKIFKKVAQQLSHPR